MFLLKVRIYKKNCSENFTRPDNLRHRNISLFVLNEKIIIEECKRGDFSNFPALVKLSIPRVYAIAFRITGSNDEAGDVVQEVMIKVWQKIEGLRDASSYNGWLRKLAVNNCYDRLRKRKCIPEVMAEERTWDLRGERISANETTHLDNEELALSLNMLTRSLSPKQKIVFILAETEGLTNEEIASATGMGKLTVKANLYHARKKISELAEKNLKF